MRLYDSLVSFWFGSYKFLLIYVSDVSNQCDYSIAKLIASPCALDANTIVIYFKKQRLYILNMTLYVIVCWRCKVYF